MAPRKKKTEEPKGRQDIILPDGTWLSESDMEAAKNFSPAPSVPEKRGRGRPQHKPTDGQRTLCAYLSGLGVPQTLIAKELGVALVTLHAHYRAELDEGMERANALVTGSLFRKAISDTHPQAVTAAIWWDKTRGGRSETVNHNVSTSEKDAKEIEAEKDSAKEAADSYRATLMSDP